MLEHCLLQKIAEKEKEEEKKKGKRVWDELYENAPKDQSVAKEWSRSAKMAKDDPRQSASPGETVVVGKCGHVVHEDCLRKFHKTTNVCPTCSEPWISVHVKVVTLGVDSPRKSKRAGSGGGGGGEGGERGKKRKGSKGRMK